MWGLFFFNKIMHRSGFEVETIAFFLCTIGLAVIASVSPSELMKTVISMILGIILFMIIGFCMRELETAKRSGMLAAAVGPLLLALVLVIALTRPRPTAQRRGSRSAP